MEAILGLYMIYSLVHFAVIQNNKTWKDRTKYEKFVTCVAMFTIISMFSEYLQALRSLFFVHLFRIVFRETEGKFRKVILFQKNLLTKINKMIYSLCVKEIYN